MHFCTCEEGFISDLYEQDIINNAPIGIFTSTPEGCLVSANARLAEMFGYENQEKLMTSVTDIASQMYADPLEGEEFMRLLEDHGEVFDHVRQFRRRDDTVFWGSMKANAIRNEDGLIVAYQGFNTDITEQKKANENVKQLEWMLSGNPISNSEASPEEHDQGYGDLTALNHDGLILRSLGRERLEKFANDYMELLGTSTSIYEANGDYALGIFTSGWCRMMDRSSRNLCNTADNAEALASGRWLCHESCWTDCSKRVIAESAPVDIACSGGIRMYGVPILAHGNVVGAINFGYGDPPNNPETLQKLSKDYLLDFDELVRTAKTYKSRPPFIIELAKKRLRTTAQLIGSMIETKQAEEMQRKSKETLRTTLHSIGDAVISTDIEGCISSINPVAESLTGWNSKEAIGQPLETVFCIINEHTRQPVESPVSNVLKSGSIVGLANHTLLIDKHGREIPIADSGAPIRNSAGDTTGVVLVFRDQTKERASMKALEESEARFRGIYDSMATGIAHVSLDFHIEAANQAYCTMLGYTEKELIGKHLKEITDPEVVEENLTKQQMLANGDIDHYQMEKTFIHKEGKTIYGLLDANLIRDADGKPAYVLGSVVDITERKHYEKVLLENRDLLDTTQRLAKIGGWEWDVNRQAMSWTDETYRIHDLKPDEIVAGSPEHIQRSLACYDQKDRLVIEEAFRRCTEKGIPYDLEAPLTTAHGQRKWVRTVAQAVMEGNRIVKVIGNIMDITERRETERALLKSKEHNAFLAETAFELVELTSIQDIYTYTVHKLYNLFEANAIVALVEYDYKTNHWHMQQVEGIGKKTAELSKLLGCDINTMEGDISTKYYKKITSGKLTELPFDISGLFNNNLSAAVGTAVKNMFSIEKMYCIAFPMDKQIIGNITIITNAKTEPINIELVEAFIQQVTTFVKKQKAEEKIREKDIQFRKLSANLPDLIFQFTRRPDGSYFVPIASEGINNIFGCQPEDVADNFDAIARVLHPDDAQRVTHDIEYSAKHLTYFTCEFRVRIPGRPVQWIFSRSTPEKLPDGSVTWYGFNANITQQKQAQLALKESNDKYRRIADNVTDVVWVTDLDMNTTYISPSVERVVGIKPEDYLQLPITKTYPPQSLKKFKETLTAEFEKEKDPESDKNRVFQLEVERYYADGTIGWDAISANFIRDHQNNPIAIQGVSRDVTERVKTEEALRESEVRFKALHNASFGGITIHDKGIILECNQGLTEISGFSYEELIGMDGLQLIAESFRETVRNNIRSGYEKPYEVFGVRKNGKEYPVRLEARNIPYKGKKVRVVEFRDITEQKQAEEEYKKLQEQFIQSQKMDAVGRLAGGVAHDYNNMLSVMIGYAELVLERVDKTSSVYRDVTEILNAANRSAELTRQLLAFSRKQTIAPKVLDVNEKIEQTLNMVRKLIGEDIDLAWLPSFSDSTILIDPSQLDQVLANLCINARDAIDTIGKITIEASVVEYDEEYCRNHAGVKPGEYVLLAVSDNGSGMDRDTAEKIFEPFFSMKGDKGTGLGMSTVYGIVKQNNGFVNVYSEVGKGTTIKIYFPKYSGKGDQHKSNNTEKIQKGQGQTILLVEDEKVIRTMAKSMLERLGYQVLAAENPGRAITLADTHREEIDLLLTDVVMPEMNGRELSLQLQKLCPKLQTLFMSGYTANVIAHQGVLEQGIQFIQKPFSVKELGTKVHMMLQQESTE
ncbi:MAG: PAS domain S-box protein [Spirochaetota bacterium]